MIPPFNTRHEEHTALLVVPTGVLETFISVSTVSTHGLTLVGIIGGAFLGIWVLWLSVVHICRLKAHVASDGTSESDPLLHQDQIQTGLQRDHTATLNHDISLCSICADLDFYKIFLDGLPEKGKISLGSLSSILEKSNQCSFCRLISCHVRRTWMLDKFPHVDLSGVEFGMFSMNCGYRREPSPASRCYRLHIIVMKDPMGLLESYRDFRAAGPLIINLMQEDAFKFGRPIDLHGRRMKDTVDTDLVKKWIRLCQENHRDKKCGRVWRMDRQLPGFVRMVDVVSMAMIPAPFGCRYVALSYVWGTIGTEYWTTKNNIAERSTSGGLSTANLPETITDSILFVRRLGERYIWIDALCIIQDDSRDKFTQLRAMDLVYGLSYLTIIAAGGMTARDPLPGCRPQTRMLQQHIEVVQGLHLQVAFPRLREVVALSTWNTRCWTYQEGALSHRRIYFTGQQVYFECQSDVFCEDIVAESKGQFSASFLRMSFAESFPGPESFGSYKRAVEQCTRRNLTIESDIVDAVTGVTNALARSFGIGDPAKAFQYGMMLTDLHLALLWQHDPHTPRARRSLPDAGSSSWPSWAWAAWRGAVIYMADNVYVGTRISNLSGKPSVEESLVDSWYIVDHSGDTMQLDVRQVSRNFLDPRTEEQKFAYSSPRRILDQMELTRDPPLESGTLIFHTTSSHFGIARRRGEGREESSACVHYGLFTSSSPPWVGTALLALDPVPATSLEFIVLSRSSSGKRDVYDGEGLMFYDKCLLHVMAVIWNEGFMERVGLGVIHEVAWIASRPEEKVVYLR
ncbi:heterokaryon incompatibility protein-domain-containing protein [Suillus placidus]|uniref:Heterokaryon incompatibility protein-domain-containing protein n=1 Tax=Suillus placidus TaxID=48579 RepID=A0A9P7A5Z2_9AGAM|nr:heterokaryon incompatibility protein-domain-containing protein [Suillus placidus]